MRGYLRLDLADNCNIRCVMCQAYNGLAVKTMSFMDFDKFVENTAGQLADWAFIQLGNVAEATVHPRFADFLRYIRRESDATIHIVTNGKLLGRYANLINETGKCLVQVSMDSVDKATHEYIREGSDYDRVMEALALLDVARTQVLLSFTLMASNIDQYDDMVAFCAERGYKMSAFPMILREEQGVIPYQLLQESLWFKRDALGGWLRRHYGQSYEGVVESSAPGTLAVGLSEFNCDAHNQDLTMFANGVAMLCGMANLGNLMSAPLDGMWGSPEAVGFRAKVDEDRGPCMRCDYRLYCLAPSMSLLDNHFSRSIGSSLSPQTRAAIGYDRNISDEEAMDRLIRDLSESFGIFDIQRDDGGYTARRMAGIGLYGATFHAKTRHELQSLMVQDTGSAHHVVLTEQGYKGYNIVTYLRRFWGLPQALGHVNLTHQEERERKGILIADSNEAIHAAIDEAVMAAAREMTGVISIAGMRWADPVLVESGYRGFNIVGFLDRLWGIPQSFGEVNVRLKQVRDRQDVVSGDDIDGLKRAIDATMAAASHSMVLQ